MRTCALQCALALACAAAAPAVASVTPVFQNVYNNGFYTPFDSTTPSNVRFGDGGWFGNGSSAPAELYDITLGLVMSGSTRNGTVDITFTFNNGDPSGLVFGSGATLYSTTIHNVFLPDASETSGVAPFNLTIPLPGVVTAGGYNDIGWSIGVSNFNSDGALGFQCSNGFSQPLGFYTNNASYYNGSSWSLFAFGSDPITGVANFVATVTVPAPASVGLIGVAALTGLRRRR